LHLRHDLENGLTLCAFHHSLGNPSAHKTPEFFRDFLIQKKGKEWYEALKANALAYMKPDYEREIEILQEFIKNETT